MSEQSERMLRAAMKDQYRDMQAEIDLLRGLLRRGFVFSANCEADPEQPEAFRRKAAEWASEVRDALAGAANQPNSTCERGEARSPVCPLPESGCDDSGSAAGSMPQPPNARECLAIINCSVHGRQIDYFLCPKCAADQPDAAPQAPIARVTVREGGGGIMCTLYAPGLPPGEYDLYCEPEATAPMLRATDNAAAQPDMVPAPDGCEVEAWELEGGRLEMHRERLKPCS